MSISVHEAISLPAMKDAKIRGGKNGLDNPIKWVTIVEVIEDINRFQEGEFLITTGYGLNEHSSHFQRLLAMNQLSGVAIYSGFYLQEIPQVFIEIANQYQLPLIELPTHLNFSTVTKSILQQILNKQMELLKEEAVKQTQIRLRGEFLEEIINRSFQSSSIIIERGKTLGYNLSLHHAVLHIKLDQYTDNELFKRYVEVLYNDTFSYMDRANRQFLLRTRLDGLIILTQIKADKDGSYKHDSLKLTKNLLENWKRRHPHIPITIGVGKPYKNVNQLSDSANEAKYAVDLSGLLLSKKEIIHYDDLATFHLLLQMKELGISLEDFYKEKIGKLLNRSKQGIDYIQTLDMYFKYNLNLQTTAAHLYIHRHTLKYRLQQIENRSGYDLSSADERLTLQLALAAYKLEQYYNP